MTDHEQIPEIALRVADKAKQWKTDTGVDLFDHSLVSQSWSWKKGEDPFGNFKTKPHDYVSFYDTLSEEEIHEVVKYLVFSPRERNFHIYLPHWQNNDRDSNTLSHIFYRNLPSFSQETRRFLRKSFSEIFAGFREKVITDDSYGAFWDIIITNDYNDCSLIDGKLMEDFYLHKKEIPTRMRNQLYNHLSRVSLIDIPPISFWEANGEDGVGYIHMKIKVFSERFRNNDKALNQLKFLKEWPGNNSMFIDSGEVMQVIKSFFVNRQYQWQNNPAIEIIKELQPDVRQGYVSLLRELLVIEKSLPIKISFYDSQIPLKKESYDECLKIIEHVLLKPA